MNLTAAKTDKKVKDDASLRARGTMCAYYQQTKMRRTQSEHSAQKQLQPLNPIPPPSITDFRYDSILPSEVTDKDAIRRITPNTVSTAASVSALHQCSLIYSLLIFWRESFKDSMIIVIL
jgi:hypothetical protein